MKLKKEVKIGLISVLALALGYIGINFLKGINLFSNESMYYVRLQDLGGVDVASPVRINGYKVGSVRNVSFGYDSKNGYSALVSLSLSPDVRLPQGSQIRVKTNVLSGAELILSTDSIMTNQFYQPGDTLQAQPSSMDLMDIATKQVMPAVVEILPELSKTLARLNEIVSNPVIDSSMLNLHASTIEMQRMMTQLSRATQRMPQIMNHIEQTTASISTVSKHAEEIKLDDIVANLNETTANLRKMTLQLQSSDNTAGLLLNDARLYNRLDSLVHSADALMKDLKENPKRYVRFSVF